MNKPLALIVEDDGRLATIFAEALRKADYDPEIVSDGRVAQARLREVIPTLILLDLHLPHISGNELLREIRADARFKESIIVLATADAIMAEELRAEADLVLLKPISFNQLRDLAARLHPP